jgi:hypothetical protein
VEVIRIFWRSRTLQWGPHLNSGVWRPKSIHTISNYQEVLRIQWIVKEGFDGYIMKLWVLTSTLHVVSGVWNHDESLESWRVGVASWQKVGVC